jgi:hypothetical protein
MTQLPRLRRALSVSLALFALQSLTTSAWADQADDLFNEGKAANKSADYPKAYEKFKAAFAIRQSPDIAGMLAQSEVRLGKTRDAAQHLVYTLRLLPVSTKPQARQEMLATLDKLKKQLAQVRVECRAGTALALDGQSIGNAPLADPLFLEPGAHRLDGSLAGFEKATLELDAKAGEDRSVALDQKAIASADGSGGGAPGGPALPPHDDGAAHRDVKQPHDGGSSPPPVEAKPAWPAIVLGSVGAVGLGVGIAGVVVGTGKRGDAEALIETCRPSACESDVAELLDEGSTMNGVGIAGFAFGGAAAIGLVTYLVFPSGAEPSDTASAAGAHARLAPGPGDVGLSLETSF